MLGGKLNVARTLVVDDRDLDCTIVIGEGLVLAVPTILVARRLGIEREEYLVTGTAALDIKHVRNVPGLGRDEKVAQFSHTMLTLPRKLTAIKCDDVHYK